MGEADRSHVLQRKARTGREEHQARVMSPPRALRLALARAADELFGLALSVSSIHVSEAGQDGVIAAFSDDRLIVVLDGPRGALGAASVDLGVLTGLIEMQTIGQVLSRAPDDRAATRTDAALVAPLLDGMLAELAANLADDPKAGWARGYRFGAMIEGPRMLGLLLEAPDFHLFRLQAELGGGAKSGEIVLALPLVAALPEEPDGKTGKGRAETAAGLRLGQGALLGAEARLTAVLHRVRMPLNETSALKPGDLLRIPREALSDTRLEAGHTRERIACRLGQINGFRAVRLTVAPALLAEGRGVDRDNGRKAPGETETDHGGAGAPASPQVAAAQSGGLDLPETGAGLTGRPDSLDDLPAPSGLAEPAPAGAAGVGAAGPPDLPDLPDLSGGDLPDLPDLSELGDLPELGDLGDLSDLPELALDD